MDLVMFFLWFLLFASVPMGYFKKYYDEKRVWNCGVCKENGKHWQLLKIEPDGSRRYKAGYAYDSEFCYIKLRSVDNYRSGK